ncbi:MAG: hypothetical protein KJN76_09100 [Eudoraea sp.]|nr:hypothetical protein [Eudoraea sp.]
MRKTMLSSGLEAMAYNINRKKSRLRFFEFGKTYSKQKNGNLERQHLSLLITGARYGDSWALENRPSDFYYLKAIVELVISRLGLSGISSSPVEDPVFSEGTSLYYGKEALVHYGVVNKKLLKHFDIKQEVLYADFYWDRLVEKAGKQTIVFKSIPKYPEVKRDFALLLSEDITFKQVREIAVQTERKILKDINLFDVYTGKNLPKGKKSYAISYTLQDEKKTLTDKQIDKIMKKLQQRYEKELGAELR